MTEEQILDFLTYYLTLRIAYEQRSISLKEKDDDGTVERLTSALEYVKNEDEKLQNSSELADVSDEALVQEVKDRGLEKYL